MGVLPDISPYLPAQAQAARNPMINTTPLPQVQPITTFGPAKTIDRVDGMDGANAFVLPPNSSVLALDQNLNVVWVIATDQNGSKSIVKGYWLGDEYVPPKPVTMEDLIAEIRDMRTKIDELEGSSNGKHHQQSAGQSKPNGSNATAGNGNGTSHSNGKPYRNVDANGSSNEAGI